METKRYYMVNSWLEGQQTAKITFVSKLIGLIEDLNSGKQRQMLEKREDANAPLKTGQTDYYAWAGTAMTPGFLGTRALNSATDTQLLSLKYGEPNASYTGYLLYRAFERQVFAKKQTGTIVIGTLPNTAVMAFPEYGVDKGYRVRSAKLFFRSDRALSPTSLNFNAYYVNRTKESLSGALPAFFAGKTDLEYTIRDDWACVDVTPLFSQGDKIPNVITLGSVDTPSMQLGKSYSWPVQLMREPRVYVGDYLYTNSFNERTAENTTPKILVSPEYLPYLEITWIPTPPSKPTSLAPSNQVVNPRQDIRLSWSSTEYQTRCLLKYRVDDGNWVTVDKQSKLRYHIIPAGTISKNTGVLEWNVQVWGQDSDSASDVGSAICELGILPQKPPVLLRPVGDYVKGLGEITFEWAFITNGIEKQKSFEISYQIGDGAWKTVNGQGTENKVSVKETVTGSAIAQWKMRVTNDYGDVSDWTETAQFSIVGVPAIPQILTITSDGNPLVTWAASDQSSFRLTVYDAGETKIYDSGNLISRDQAFRIPADLLPGQYKFRLSVRNAFGIESPVAELVSSVAPASIPAPEIEVFDGNRYCTVYGPAGAEVYRDGELIGEIKETFLHDYSGVNHKAHEYHLLVRDGYNFVTSASAIGACHFIGDTLALASDPASMAILDETTESNDKRKEMVQVVSVELLLDGRSLPLFEFGEHESVVFERSYYVDPEQLDVLRSFLRKRETLLYRDRTGWNKCVCLTSISSEDYITHNGRLVTLTFTEVEK